MLYFFRNTKIISHEHKAWKTNSWKQMTFIHTLVIPIILAISGCSAQPINKMDVDLISQIRTRGIVGKLILPDSYANTAPSGPVRQYEVVPTGLLDYPLYISAGKDNVQRYIYDDNRLSDVQPTITDGSVLYFYGKYTLDDGTQIIPSPQQGFGDKPLAFGVMRGIGLVYLYGKGDVVMKNGRTVKIP